MAQLKKYEFAGLIVGKCLYESCLGNQYRLNVKANFARSFLAQMLGKPVTYRHFRSDDPDLYNGKIRYILENDVESMSIPFAEDVYDENGQLCEVSVMILWLCSDSDLICFSI